MAFRYFPELDCGDKRGCGKGRGRRLLSVFSGRQWAKPAPDKAMVEVGGVFYITGQHRFSRGSQRFPRLSQGSPQLLLTSGVWRPRERGPSLSSESGRRRPPRGLSPNTGGWEGWVEGGGRQVEKLKTSITFHFLNLKQITVCGIY